MKPRIIFQGNLPDDFIISLSKTYDATSLKDWEASLPGSTDVDGNFRAMVSWARSKVDRPLLERLPSLEIIAGYGVGYDLIDLKAVQERGIAVTNTPDVLTDDVADLAIGLMIGASRRLSFGERFVRDGRWAAGKMPPLARKFAGKRVGIVGMGRIGQAIAKRCEPFGIKISYQGPRAHQNLPYTYFSNLIDMARDSDFLIISCNADETTRDLIGARELAALGENGILINVARGIIVNEMSLIEALQKGTIAGAGLDVYADEPNVPEALLSMDSVFLLPHLGSTTVETKRAMGELVLANLAAHFEGKLPLTPVPGIAVSVD